MLRRSCWRIGTAFAPLSLASCAGRRLIFGRLHVNRANGGCASVRPVHGPELRALRPLQGTGPYVFVTEAGTPTTTTVQRSGRAAKLPFPVHPHMPDA
jgi:hypothetical protein